MCTCCLFLQVYELQLDGASVCPNNCRGSLEPFQSRERLSAFQKHLAVVAAYEEKRGTHIYAPPQLLQINWLKVNKVHSFRRIGIEGYHNTALLHMSSHEREHLIYIY